MTGNGADDSPGVAVEDTHVNVAVITECSECLRREPMGNVAYAGHGFCGVFLELE